MKVGSKEWYEMRQQFERDYRKVASGRFDKETDKNYNNRGFFYQDGEVNKAFKFYMIGYESAMCLNRLDD